MSLPNRELQAIAQVACPVCDAPIGQPCRDDRQPSERAARPFVHGDRRRAWQARKAAADPLEAADILMSDQKDGEPGRWHTYLLLAPVTPRGRAALPGGPTRVEHPQVRATLARLRGQGLVILREA